MKAAKKISGKRSSRPSAKALLKLPGVPDPAFMAQTVDGIKPLTKAETSRAVRAVLARREELDERVGSCCDILGSMVGVKVRDGKALPSVGITFFVREKIDEEDLAPKQRIPKVLKVGDRRITTDVMVWRDTERHALKDTRILMDDRSQGTMTAFAQAKAGLFGLACGHCLLGPDLNPATPVAISMDSTPSPDIWTKVGASTMVLFIHGGQFLLGGKGYVDCGLFTLGEATLQSRALKSKLVGIAQWTTLPGQVLYGVSTVKATQQDNHQRRAKVLGIQAYALDDFCDVVLDADTPGMRGGDSGMLWFTEQMQAAAVHCHGEKMTLGQGSVRTTAMSAQRAAAALAIQFRMG